jgi:chromosome segregation ATPase
LLSTKDSEIAQLRADLVRASESATARKNEFTKLIERLKSAEQALEQEVKKNEDLRRIYTVHGNTQHFSKRRVEEFEVKNEELEEQKAELQQWFCRAQREVVELREQLDRLGRLVQPRGV